MILPAEIKVLLQQQNQMRQSQSRATYVEELNTPVVNYGLTLISRSKVFVAPSNATGDAPSLARTVQQLHFLAWHSLKSELVDLKV